MTQLVVLDQLARRIHVIRGHRVMLSFDLAELYGVETRVLVQAVTRNEGRFPDDFCFQLSASELGFLKSQIVISKGRGGSRHLPYAFTEHGVLMLSSVLRSERAIETNIAVVRAFVRLREMLSGNKDLARKLKDLEKKYDSQFRIVFEAIEELMAEPEPQTRRKIGFSSEDDR